MTRMRLTIALAATTSLLACGDSHVAPAPSPLDGPWTSPVGGTRIGLDLTWTGNSVKGSGHYNVLVAGLGCGGATLHGTGTVAFAASVSGSAITGHMTFDNGWTPNYTGTLVDDSKIDGEFRSADGGPAVDPGPCPYPLYRGLVP